MKHQLHRSLAVAIVLSMPGLMAAGAQPALGDDGKSSTCNMINKMTFSSEFLLDPAGEPTVEDAAEKALKTPFMEGTDGSGGTEVVAEDSDDASVVVKNKNGDGSAIIDLETTEQGKWALHTIAECVEGAFSETDYLLAPSETTKWYLWVWPGGATPGYVIDNNIPSGRIDALRAGMANYSNRAGGNGPDFVYQGVTSGSNDFDACNNNNNKIYDYNGLEEAVGLALTGWCITAPDQPEDEPTITAFQITFEASPAQGWYAGVDSPGTSWDLRSIATHEAGHATGFHGRHFANDSAKCPVPRTAATATMCPGAPGIRGTTWLRTLESADTGAISAAY